MKQGNIFELIYPEFKITNHVRLIEFFSGIGSQIKALKYLTPDVESYKTCEWNIYSMHAYNKLHIKDFNNYSKGMTKEELISAVKGISLDYNKPLTDKALNAKEYQWLANVYNDVKATHNLINIMDVKGNDLEITDIDKYTYILTWSFPCQDLSIAGDKKGMEVSQKDGGTRSGLAWEVLRILKECKEKPQVLIMENVPPVIGKGGLKVFQVIENELSKLGYTNYIEILNAKNYGIPQNRKRCFMVSLHGNYIYYFPEKIPLKYRLNHFLKDKVNKNYYLSKEKIDAITKWHAFRNPLEDLNPDRITTTLTAVSNVRNNAGMQLVMPEATKKGYTFATEGDGVYINRPNQKRGVVQKGMIQTIKTSAEDIGVCTHELSIRKLTPKECWRLMAFQDSDFECVKDISNNQLYHMAGDSICVNVLIGIFAQLFNKNAKKEMKNYIESIKEKK